MMAFVGVNGWRLCSRVGVREGVCVSGRRREGWVRRGRSTVRLNVSLQDRDLAELEIDVNKNVKEGETEEVEVPKEKRSVWAYLWPRLLLLAVSAAYGTNFGMVKLLDESLRHSASALLRFSVASAALLPFMIGAPKKLIREGLRIGVFVFGGYVFQAFALQSTEANKIAFLSALSVVFVPLLNTLLPAEETKKKSSAPILAILLALSGVALLELGGVSAPSFGDLQGLIQGLLFSCGFVFNERAMEKYPGNALALSGAQLFSIALLSFGWYAVDSFNLYGAVDVQGLSVAIADPLIISGVLYTGLVTTGFAVGCENFALAKVSASELSVLFSTQPFFAAAFSAYLLGESLSSNGAIGGALIISACLIGQIPRSFMEKTKRFGRRLFGKID